MLQVNSSQFNYQYGNQMHFPYSIGRLVSYIKNNKDLEPHFKFEKTFVFRPKLEEYVQQCKDTDILLCSCYVWNWEITTLLAKKVKELNPACLIIFGGPQVPNYSDGFFEKYPYVDIIVHSEGEITIENIFTAYLKDKNFLEVKGIETKDFRNEPQPRTDDLDKFPSPYLTNIVWDLVEKIDGLSWIASWETNRGCPYQCTFCDWGSATNTKLRKWSEETLMKEIEWFSKNKIPYVDCCDANFGIFQEKDYKLAVKLKEECLKHGYPERVRPAWAKFSSEKIIPIAKELQKAGLLRAVTLALQSLDETTLDIVKRANIKFDKFSELTETFRKNGIPTYTELIMGMPGETVNSWKEGLEIIAADTKIGSIYVYNCGVFANAPMNEPSYVKLHEIKKLRSPIFLGHSSIHERGMPEYEDIAIGAKSFTLDDLKQINLYSWLIQTFHSFGIFEYASKYYHKTYGMKYMEFYDVFLDYCNNVESMFSLECKKVKEHITRGYSGKGWDHYDENLGDIYWPIEEASWLRLASIKEKLIDEMHAFLTYLEKTNDYNTPKDVLEDLVKFQVFLLTTKNTTEKIKSECFNFDWKNFFVTSNKLQSEQKKYFYDNLIVEKDDVQWAFKTMWYGRSSIRYKFHPEKLQEGEFNEEMPTMPHKSTI